MKLLILSFLVLVIYEFLRRKTKPKQETVFVHCVSFQDFMSAIDIDLATIKGRGKVWRKSEISRGNLYSFYVYYEKFCTRYIFSKEMTNAEINAASRQIISDKRKEQMYS